MSEDVATKADDEGIDLISDKFNCPICLCDVSITNSFFLKQCGCRFCRICLAEFVQLHINEQTIQRLKCPGLHIKDMYIQRDEIKHLVSRNDFLVYARLKHEQVVMQDPSRVFCPGRDCGAICYSKRHGPQPTRCMTCGHKFCRLCLNAWPGPSHVCPEDLVMLVKPESIAPILPSKGASVTDVEAEAEAVPNTAETRNIKPGGQEQNLEVKRCPKCGIPIERAAGCHQIYCMNCGHSFCWSCLASLDHEGYMQHVLEGKCRDGMLPVENMGYCGQCLACLASTGVIGCLGILGLVCAPLVILCSPCLALNLRRYLNQMADAYVDNGGVEPVSGKNTRINGFVDEDTDSEMDSVT